MSEQPPAPQPPANYPSPPPVAVIRTSPAQAAPPGAKPDYLADAHSKKMLAGLLAIFLGNFGIHKFVLGYTGAGVIMILLNCTGIGLPIIRIISFIEGIMYLMKTDEDFYQTYIANEKQWF